MRERPLGELIDGLRGPFRKLFKDVELRAADSHLLFCDAARDTKTLNNRPQGIDNPDVFWSRFPAACPAWITCSLGHRHSGFVFSNYYVSPPRGIC